MTLKTVVVTGSGGLIGAEAVRFYAAQSQRVIGIDNDMRSYFFGAEASTNWSIKTLERDFENYEHMSIDIRDAAAISQVFSTHNSDIELVIHAAAQPSHDWAASEPFTDFHINAVGTMNLLEACRQRCEDAVFVLTSTNKVYGDTPNRLPLLELDTRWELDPQHQWSEHGIPEEMSIDQSTHSLFGASKLSGDIITQEYGRYFGMKTAVFRGGCLTGPGHSGSVLHGFLAYLVQCAATETPYTVYGYGGKQVRDNIHSLDLVKAFDAFRQSPRPGEVYNMGGGRYSNCSMLEAIDLAGQVTGNELQWNYSPENRVGDHIWWISDTRRFQQHYPNWHQTFSIEELVSDIYLNGASRWLVDPEPGRS